MSVHCDYLTQRNGVWHYYRRVPSEYNTLDLRHHVRLSTKIKVANDRTGTKAGRVAAKLNAAQEAYWRSLSDGKAADAKQSYTDAVKLARSLGLDYLAPSDAAQRPINELLTRIQKTALSKMSADQVRKWTSAKKRAIEILIDQRGVTKPFESCRARMPSPTRTGGKSASSPRGSVPARRTRTSATSPA